MKWIEGRAADPSSLNPFAGAIRARPSAECDEMRLVERLKAGDEASYEQLVRRHGGRMLAVARRLLRNEDQARDAVQEAFLSAFRGIRRFRQVSRLGTWLHRITVNAALMQIRRDSSRPEVELDRLLPAFDASGRHAGPVPVVPPEAERRCLREETRRLVRAKIAELPERYRTVLVLRDIEEMETREVAELLGVTRNAVKVRLHRARQAVAKLLSQEPVHADSHPGPKRKAGIDAGQI